MNKILNFKNKSIVLMYSISSLFLCLPSMVFAAPFGGATIDPSSGALSFQYNQDNYDSEMDLRMRAADDIIGTATPEVTRGVDLAQNLLMFLMGVVLIALLIYFIYCCVKIGAAGDDSNARKEAITKTLYTLLGMGVVGGAGTIIAIAFNLLA